MEGDRCNFTPTLSSPSQRLSLRGMSPSGAEPEPAATFILPPAYRRAGIKEGEILLENFNYL